MHEARWYAIRSSAHKEGILYKQLLAKSFETYYPEVKVNPVNPRSAKWRPFFPNYLFVRIKLGVVGSGAFNYIPFSQGLVEFGGQPASVPDRMLQEIRRHVDDINSKGGISHIDLQPGTVVRVVDGPFRGYEGIFDVRLSETDRVMILLKLLQKRHIRVEMHVGAIRKVTQRS